MRGNSSKRQPKISIMSSGRKLEISGRKGSLLTISKFTKVLQGASLAIRSSTWCTTPARVTIRLLERTSFPAWEPFATFMQMARRSLQLRVNLWNGQTSKSNSPSNFKSFCSPFPTSRFLSSLKAKKSTDLISTSRAPMWSPWPAHRKWSENTSSATKKWWSSKKNSTE